MRPPERPPAPDVDAYLERARIQPGAVAGGRRPGVKYFQAHEAYARQVDGDDPPGRPEAAVLRAELGWIDSEIGTLLGMPYSNVSRRRVNGFSGEQVEAMRRAIAAS